MERNLTVARHVVKRNLIRHLKIHTREKHFTCEGCGKLFSDADNLHEHRKIHTGLRFFSCETCGKVFIEERKLVRHSKTHSGVRYSCETCGKSFSDKSNLAKHCRRVHIRERKAKDKQCSGTGSTKTKTVPQVFKVSVSKQCP